ncbi:putative lipoprotein [Pseudomonas sp. M47T1]|uniref:YbaY family lipoprotein n=1 Tax=unclassified Pseudomonas TaxID=196821 RepID=UPI0002607E2B|nr:YbaY family lipoprotein [Pseudomonas sp. M47T1]EIK93835.1 putative lipoprotein [Pseudomonas sp. M47T1]
MPLRPLVLLSLVALLAACSSDKPKPVAPVAPAAKPAAIGTQPLGPLPAFQRELTGTLLGAPAGAEVELALLAVDERSRPQQLLASSKQIGTGKPLNFQLRFNPEAFPQNLRVELRGRASQSGVLILHLPSVPVNQPTTQSMGQLQLLQAP